VKFETLPDPGSVTLSGLSAVGYTLVASVVDSDAANGPVSYQWQKSSDGSTWNDIVGSLGQQYTVVLGDVSNYLRCRVAYQSLYDGSAKNVFSGSTSLVRDLSLASSVLTTQTPSVLDQSDGLEDYELGMSFQSSVPGKVWGVRFYRALNEVGEHTGRLWTGGGVLLSSRTFGNETGPGWQSQLFTSPVSISAGTTYMVSVSTNDNYVYTANGLATPIVNGSLTGLGAAYNLVSGGYPGSVSNSNYFVDVIFTAD
jgi:hypothetical protein